MRCWCLAAFVCLLSTPLLLAQKEGWLPITPEERQMKEVPEDPGAAAVLLYYADYINDDAKSEFIYKRIKVLKEDGKKYANVEIEIGPLISLNDLKARTIRPDGSIVDFDGKPFDKVLFQGRSIKVLVKSFTLPEVEVGSIIECRYNLQSDWLLTSDHWV